MKIVEKFSEINVDSFVRDYIKACGVEDVDRYLSPVVEDIELESHYKNIHKAYEVYEEHMMNGGKIGLVVDSDVDGQQSAAIFYQHTQDVNPTIEIITYFHDAKQHGLADRTVFKQILDSDIDLLVIPDAGSSDLDEIRLLKQLEELGWKPMDIIILDHHSIAKGKSVEEYACVVNNKISDEVVNKETCGAVVTWHFCRYVDYINGFDYSDKYIDHCAVATVGDVQPLTCVENRTLAYYGFANFTNPFLKAIVEKFSKMGGGISCVEDWGWNCNAKMNGIVRSGNVENIRDLFYAMVEPERVVTWKRVRTEKEKEWNIVDKMVTMAEAAGSSKSAQVKKFVDKLLPTVNKAAKVILIENNIDIPKPITGDVANKLQEHFSKPCLIYNQIEDEEGFFGGSCRSPIPFKTTLQKSKLFEFAEGHQPAFGFKIKKDNMDALVEYCNSLKLNAEPTYNVVKLYSPSTIPLDLFEVIQANYEQWGKDVDNPQFAFNFKINSSDIKCYPTVARMLVDGISFVKFYPSKKFKEDFMVDESKTLEVTIIGTLGINVYNGYRNPQVVIQNYEVKEKKKVLDWDDIF